MNTKVWRSGDVCINLRLLSSSLLSPKAVITSLATLQHFLP